jgi:steroid 5-alpha reductase family enzyme
MELQAYLTALALILGIAVAAWLVSVVIRNVAFVDSLWSLFFLVAAVVFAFQAAPLSARGLLVTLLVAVWALRLSIYITARNWGEPEDYRYRSIRNNNEPGFAFKSLYIVFGLQAALAWIIALPLIPAIMNPGGIGPLETAALALWLVGFVFEAGGDYQLSKFKREGFNKGRVLDTGLWRYTRHPNYFGDFCVWWAFYLFAVAAGGWWTVLSPLLMSFLLLKVSGVAMLEKTITERRPEYADYIRRTNAFFPGLPKSALAALGGETR